jgi:alpha,alpha-trehalase
VVFSERDDSGKTEYDRIIEYYRSHDVKEYDIKRYYDSATGKLTPLFYEADRAMRESGSILPSALDHSAQPLLTTTQWP